MASWWVLLGQKIAICAALDEVSARNEKNLFLGHQQLTRVGVCLGERKSGSSQFHAHTQAHIMHCEYIPQLLTHTLPDTNVCTNLMSFSHWPLMWYSLHIDT